MDSYARTLERRLEQDSQDYAAALQLLAILRRSGKKIETPKSVVEALDIGPEDDDQLKDWYETFGYLEVDRREVFHIAGIDEGCPDEEDWLCVGLLKDGRWFYVSAGCDYTGWD